MRTFALILGAIVVLAVGLVLVQGSGDDGSGTSAGTETTQETAAPAATTSTAAEPEATVTAPKPKPAAPRIPTIVFADGAPQGGVRTLEFAKGEEVRFRVRSDVAEEVHVHGFDKTADVKAGQTVAFTFTAASDGIYEVEMEGSATQIAALEIRP